jgi:adenylate cyclase
MGIEIERKFLVTGRDYPKSEGQVYRQGYLPAENGTTIRVRTVGAVGYITIKGASVGLSRKEFEYRIPLEDANEMLSETSTGYIVEKVRYRVQYEALIWEIDEFRNENDGLVTAEVELESEEQDIRLPKWIGREVSTEQRYSNLSLSREPYRLWKK